MIYTVTFNPAIDYVVKVPDLKLGSVNRTETDDVQIGGKGINVSVILNNLGVRNIALGFIAGFTGEEIKNKLEKEGVKTDFIELNKGLTRINVKIKADEETEINGTGPDIPQSAVEELFGKLSALKNGDIIILAGSIPKSIPNDIYEKIMERLSDKGIQFVVDATKDLLCNVLKYKPFLIKPNNFELEEFFDVKLDTDNDIIYYAKKLQEKGARNVLVSMGGKGAILIDENGKDYKMDPINGNVKNTVGAGDSMVAGFVAGYIKKNDYSYALKLGSASGSATAFSLNLATKQEIMDILQKM